MRPKQCLMPSALPLEDSDLYRRLLDSHCQAPDKGEPDHKCQGAITITRASLIARCKRCGDCKGVFHE